MARSVSRSVVPAIRMAPSAWSAVLLVMLAGFASRPSRADMCPANCMFSQCSTAASGGFSTPPSHGSTASSASYDLIAGTISSLGYIQTSERYVVEATPVGLPVAMHLDISFRGYGYNQGVSFSIAIPGKGIRSESLYFDGFASIYGDPYDVRHNFAIDFTVAPGEVFYINGEASGGLGLLGGYGSTNVSYNLAAPPAGTRVRSCHGVLIDTTTPARPSTWGAIKTLYR